MAELNFETFKIALLSISLLFSPKLSIYLANKWFSNHIGIKDIPENINKTKNTVSKNFKYVTIMILIALIILAIRNPIKLTWIVIIQLVSIGILLTSSISRKPEDELYFDGNKDIIDKIEMTLYKIMQISGTSLLLLALII
jgi:hypothetical protein